jgi:hypothetical protein
MADTTLRIPVPTVGGAGSAPRSIGERAGALGRRLGRSASPAVVARYAWAGLWLPYWLGSDVPAPALPSRDPKPPAAVGLAGEQVVRTLDRLGRRIWLLWALNILIRGAWLGGVVGIGWLLVERLGGPDFEPEGLVPVAIALFALGVLFAAVVRPGRRRTARMLDRSFRLHERMTTALENLGREVPPPGVRAQIVYLQMADAANVVAELRRHPAFGFRLPLRELVLALACVLLLASLYFLRGVGGGIPDLAAAGVPGFTPAASRPQEEPPPANPAAAAPEGQDAPTSAEVQERAARSNEARRDLATLGDAMDDHPATRPAAEAIARGDYDQAAEELRDLAANADELSPEAREQLANDLDEAADQMSDPNGELAQATRNAADGLREGEQSAEQGMQELGDAVQETGDDVVSQQELADQMQAAQAAESSGSSEQSQSGDQSQGGEQQAGESGESGSESDNRRAADGSSESGEGQQTSGEPGEAGAEAQSGEAGGTESSEGADRGSNPGQAQSQGQQGEQRGRLNRSAQPGQPGVSQSGSGQPGEAGSEGQQGGESGAQPQEGGSAEQGAGAGSGDGQEQAGGEQGAPGSGEESQAGEGIPAEEQVTTAELPEGGEPTGDPRTTDDAIELDNSGGEGIQTSNSSESASQGSGTGVMTASGDASQQPVGEAGPDSNRVPADRRDIVEDYFSEDES